MPAGERIPTFEQQLLEMFGRDWKFNSLTAVYLGGSGGSAGGVGAPPGGFIGQLAQRFVTNDTDETESLYSSGSLSLVDNLNRLRARSTATQRFWNRSGGSLPEGSVMVWDGSNTESTTTTTAANDQNVAGVLRENTSSGSRGFHTLGGYVPRILVDGTCTLLDYLYASSTPGRATPRSSGSDPGCFGRALSSGGSTVPVSGIVFLSSRQVGGSGGGGGSGTPGGSDTQVQFNDGGAFGGSSGLTYNKTTTRLSVTGGLGIATPSGTYRLNVNAGTATNFHVHGSAVGDDGFYLTSLTSDFYMSHSAAYDGANWIAKAATAAIFGAGSGEFAIYEDSGLSAGSAFSPTSRFQFTLADEIRIGATSSGSGYFRVARYSDGQGYLTGNLRLSGSWLRDNTALEGAVLSLGGSTPLVLRYAPAGANPATLQFLFSVDRQANIISGTSSVPSGGSRLYLAQTTSTPATVASGTGALYMKQSSGSPAWAWKSSEGVEYILRTREKLIANRTYYVRTDGSNSNDGLSNTSGGAFLTWQKAIDTVAGLDRSTFDVIIQIGDGSYSENVNLKEGIGSGSVTIQGNSSTPTNVAIANTSAINGLSLATIYSDNVGTKYILKDFRVTGDSANLVGGIKAKGGKSAIDFSGIDFAAAYVQIWQIDNASMTAIGNYTISAGAVLHWATNGQAILRAQTITITLSGTPAFATAFSSCGRVSCQIVSGITFSGSATGTRYLVSANSLIDTGGGGANYLPGNAAGSATTGGQYV